jgi:hypothetical protein
MSDYDVDIKSKLNELHVLIVLGSRDIHMGAISIPYMQED